MRESKKQPLLILALLLVGSVLLTGCTGGIVVNNWPGVNTDGTAVYLSNQMLHRLNINDGLQQWQSPAKADAKHALFAAAAYSGDAVYTADNGGRVQSINSNTGSVNWAFEASKKPFSADLILVDDLLFAASTDGTLYVLNTNGGLQWKFDSKNTLLFAPTVHEGMVYLASMDKNLYALDAKDGTKKWEFAMQAIALDSPVVSKDGSLVLISTLGNKLFALDAASGAVKWEKSLPAAAWSKPIELNEMVVLGDNAGKVTALDLTTGSDKWATDMGAPVISSGVVVGDGWVFGTEKGDLVKLDQNGGKVWTRTIAGSIYTDLVTVDEKILVGIMKGETPLAAFDANGNQLWAFTPAK